MSRQKGDAVEDRIGQRIAQWRETLPGLDTSGMAILGRARWITLRTRPEIDAVFSRHGLDAGEFDVLATLRRAGPPFTLTPTQLYRMLMVSSGGLTARLNKLTERGLVKREANAQDGRSQQVVLSAAGRRLVERAVTEDMAVEAKLLSVLDRDQQRTLATLLAALVNGLDAADADPDAADT